MLAHRIATYLGLGAVIFGCTSQSPPPLYSDFGSLPLIDAGKADTGRVEDCSTPGTAGCLCTTAGAVASCGRVEFVSGDYVTCSIGNSTCDGTRWGQCVSNRLVAQSHIGRALSASGFHSLSTNNGCSNPCNPNCTRVTGDNSDIDAGGLSFTDGGVSITPTTGLGPGSGPCKGLWCQVNACQGKPKTSLSGAVYDPAGKNPLYNAYVYVPVDPSAALPPFTTGVSCDTCSGAGNVAAIAVAQTGPDGKFTLQNVPYGDNVPLVVQMGKWRRKITLPAVTACQDNPVPANFSRLPRNRFDGDGSTADIPHMAMASGDSDPFECLLLKAGIDAEEIQMPGKGARIDYYVMNGIDRAPGGAPKGTTLTSNLAKLKEYDVVLLPCEGKENAHNTDAPNLVTYTGMGGRLFTTHYGYVWLATPYPTGTAKNQTSFYSTADWSKLDQWDNTDPLTAAIDQSFPKGQAFAQWLQYRGATSALGSLSLNEPRHDARAALAGSQRWVYGSSKSATNGVPDMLLSMTFNTPVGASSDKQCGRVVFSDFHVSAKALVDTSSTCSSNNDCGFGATCNPAVIGQCTNSSCNVSSDCDSGYSCGGATQGTCSQQACVTGSDCGSRACSGGSLGQCRVPCFSDSDCSGIWGSVCSGGAVGTCSARSCNSNYDCGGAGYCWSGKCSAVSCTSNANCGSVRTCQNATVGACTKVSSSCSSDTTCKAIRSTGVCSGQVTGTCSSGNCFTSSDCGTSGTCSGGQPGTCSRSCSTNADCINGLSCVGGKCVGCVPQWSWWWGWTDNCPWGSTCNGYKSAGCSDTSSYFPLTCRNGDLTAQEKALEFMLFDLSACVSPDSWTPPSLGVKYDTVTFNLDFMANCPVGRLPVWRELDWQAQIPNTGNIVFTAATAVSQADLASARTAPLASATTTTAVPSWDMAIIESTGSSAFTNVDPPISSQTYLRIAVTLNPTADNKASPTLLNWQVQYECEDRQ